MDHRYVVLGVAAASNFSLLSARLSLSPVVPRVINDFAVSKSEIGLALTGLWAAYALLQFPSGLLSYRYGERRVMLAALALGGIGSLLLAFSPNFSLLAAFAFFLGAGAGLYYTVGTTLLTRLFEERSGLAISVHGISVPLAGLVTPIGVTWIAVRWGWRLGVAATASLAFLVLLLALWRIPDRAPQGESLGQYADLRTLARRALQPQLAFTVLLAVIAYFTWQAFASFLPTFLIEYHGLSAQRASIAFGAVFVTTALTLPVIGGLSDRFGRDALLAGCMLIMAGAFGLFVITSSLLGIIAAVALLGLGTAWEGPLQTRFFDNLPADERGPLFGFVRTLYLFLSAAGSWVTASIADTLGWPAAFTFLLGLAVLGAVALGLNHLFGTPG